MKFCELGSNSCSSLLIQDIPYNQREWNEKSKKYVVKPVAEAFWVEFVIAVAEWNEDEEYEVDKYAYFVIYLVDQQVNLVGDFLLSIGFERTPSVLAGKTERKCSIWFVPVEVILKKYSEISHD